MQPPNYDPSHPLAAQGMQPVMFYSMRNTGGRVEGYRHKQSKVLGALQIIVGILCIVVNVISLGIGRVAGIEFVGHGIWNGVLFLITGLFGLGAGFKQTKCLIVTFMVFCIISASFTTVLLSLGIVGAIIAQVSPTQFEYCNYYNSYYYYNNYNSYDGYNRQYGTGNENGMRPPGCTLFKVVIAMEALMAIMAVLEAIFAIWGSTLGCKALCCPSMSAGCPNGVMLIPQYCCSSQQVTMENQTQMPFQQMPYYVWPNQGNVMIPPQAPIGPVPNGAGPNNGDLPWNPPAYVPQVLQAPPYSAVDESKADTLC